MGELCFYGMSRGMPWVSVLRLIHRASGIPWVLRAQTWRHRGSFRGQDDGCPTYRSLLRASELTDAPSRADEVN